MLSCCWPVLSFQQFLKDGQEVNCNKKYAELTAWGDLVLQAALNSVTFLGGWGETKKCQRTCVSFGVL